MPVRYVCRHCGYLLWEFKHVGQDCYGLPSPSEIIAFYGGICPRCKRELSKPTLRDITITVKGASLPEQPRELYETIPGGNQQAPTSIPGTKSPYTAEVS